VESVLRLQLQVHPFIAQAAEAAVEKFQKAKHLALAVMGEAVMVEVLHQQLEQPIQAEAAAERALVQLQQQVVLV